MSEMFTASNGLTLSIYEDGIIWEGGTKPKRYTDALREFFLHERDQELGRWRWPEDPDYVVYQACDDRVLVVDEETGNSKPFRRFRSVFLNSGYNGAARAYFLAHPEPKPWMEVPEGVYAVTREVHPYERLLQFRNGEWLHLYRFADGHESDSISAELCAKAAHDEGRLTRLMPVVDDA